METNKNLDLEYPYPKQAYSSVETEILGEGTIIAETVITPTAPVDSHNDVENYLRVANTEYVHKQIVEEIDYGSEDIIIDKKKSDSIFKGTIHIKRKSKFVIVDSADFNVHLVYYTNTGEISGVIATIDEKYRPLTQQDAIIKLVGYADLGTDGSKIIYVPITIKTNGEILLNSSLKANSMYTYEHYNKGEINFGYQCQ